MKKRRRLYPTIVFVLAMFAWFSLLGLWIYWYISNYMMFIEVGEKISPRLIFSTINIAVLVGGIVLLAAVATGMSLMFGKLIKQLTVTTMYDGFIANVSHELKSPLAAIQLYLQTMKDRKIPRSNQEEFIYLMIKDPQRLGNLIDSILEISGLESNKMVFQQTLHQAEELVYTLVEEAVDQFQLPEGTVRIKGKAPCTCKADRRALKMVFNNLFDNAIKYSKDPVHLSISLKNTARKFIIEVTDRGIGIPPSDQKEVFRKFRRLYNPDSPNVKGTGLGLYWVREIVGQHQGRVSVTSEGRGKGTTFKIELPVYKP